jgi:hypothetical protein
MPNEDEKIRDFLHLVEERLIRPVENTDVGKSCTATLMLIFAGMDSLSKITCSEDEFKQRQGQGFQGSRKRFKRFLADMLGGKYKDCATEIIALRNDIVHTGINAKVILSREEPDAKHLRRVDGHLWVNTRQFFLDFVEAFKTIRGNIESGGSYYKRAQERLKPFSVIEIADFATGFPSAGPDDSVF